MNVWFYYFNLTLNSGGEVWCGCGGGAGWVGEGGGVGRDLGNRVTVVQFQLESPVVEVPPPEPT